MRGISAERMAMARARAKAPVIQIGAKPWRVGRSVGRTIYDANGCLIGMLDTPALAQMVVDSVNEAGES